MKEQLIKLATEKGFKSTIIGKSVEAKHTSKDFYYLWLCELQKWLRDAHQINLWPSTWGPNNEFYHIEDITKGLGNDMVIVGNGGKGNKDYTIALEEGLKEALTLIKK